MHPLLLQQMDHFLINQPLHQPSFIRSFVRREGRFTKAQRSALIDYWPYYGVDTHQQSLNLDELFIKKQPIVIDIGFGNGESLLYLAKQHANLNFLGVEVYRPGIGNLLRNIYLEKIENIRVVNKDVVELLQNNISTNSISSALIWFPDPWPKKRHHKRRLIQVHFLELLATKIVTEGELSIATDWKPYAEHIQETVQQCRLFKKCQASKFIKHRPQTKFERRGKKLGHEVFAQTYIKK